MPDLWTQSLTLPHPDRPGRAFLAVARFGPGEAPAPGDWLSAAEQAHLGTLVHDRRRSSWLTGRWAAKQALGGLTSGRRPGEFTVLPGVFDQPVVTGPCSGIQVTLSHTDGWAAAAAFPETHPLGLDLELWGPRQTETLAGALPPGEVGLWTAAGIEVHRAHALLWAAREAVGKALRTGLTVPLEVLACGPPEDQGAGWETRADQVPQYRVAAGAAGPVVLALAFPQMCPLRIDFAGLEAWRSALPAVPSPV